MLYKKIKKSIKITFKKQNRTWYEFRPLRNFVNSGEIIQINEHENFAHLGETHINFEKSNFWIFYLKEKMERTYLERESLFWKIKIFKFFRTIYVELVLLTHTTIKCIFTHWVAI